MEFYTSEGLDALLAGVPSNSSVALDGAGDVMVGRTPVFALATLSDSKAARVRVVLRSQEPVAQKTLLFVFRFFDAARRDISPTRLPGLGWSEAQGLYMYARDPLFIQEGLYAFTIGLAPPDGCVEVAVGCRLWGDNSSVVAIREIHIGIEGAGAATFAGSETAAKVEAAAGAKTQRILKMESRANRLLRAVHRQDAAAISDCLQKLELSAVIEGLMAARDKRSAIPADLLERARRRNERHPSPVLSKVLAAQLARSGDLAAARGLFETIDPRRAERLRQFEALTDWFVQELATRRSAAARTGARPPESSSHKLVYVLHNCFPYHNGGYAVRAAGVIKGLMRAGWELTPIGRLGYPLDRRKGVEAARSVSHGGVTYRFAPDEELNIENLAPIDYVRANAAWIAHSARTAGAGVVMSASFHANGMAGALAAAELGLPHVYEIRGMDWLTRASAQPGYIDSEECRLSQQAELITARESDLTFAITAALRDWLVQMETPFERIALLPNCAPDDLHEPPRAPESDGAAEPGVFTITYVGSVVFYEGLDTLLRAIALLDQRGGVAVRLHIVGDGAALPGLRALCRQLKIGDRVQFWGRVAHEFVVDFYARADVAIIPRSPTPVTEMISPIKPLECFLLGKCVIASDVAALAEIVADGERGMTFKAGDPEDLARCIEAAAGDPARRRRMEMQAYRWTVEHRLWRQVAAEAGRRIARLTAQTEVAVE